MIVDLVICGGTIVTAGSMNIVDIGVRTGKIVQMGGDMQGGREIDARGKYVFPGGVDVHVHLTAVTALGPGVESRPDDF